MFQSKTGVAALSVASNLALTLLKLVIGLVTGSVSVIAEAIHSSVDLLAACIAFFAVRTSGKSPDEEHPYGHGKVENVSGTVEGILIFLAAGLIIYEAATKLVKGAAAPSVDLGLVAMGVAVVANFIVSRQLFKVARRTESAALEADAYHLTTDIVTSLGVFVGLIVVGLTKLPFLDPLVAMAVAVLIIRAAWQITGKSFVDLVDRSLPEEERNRIMAIMGEHKELMAGFHHMRTRKSGSERQIDLHLVVDSKASVAEAHALCDHLEDDLKAAFGNCSLTIHIEPCDRECARCPATCKSDARREPTQTRSGKKAASPPVG
jgi:cation diffusion facilitator family transporter